MHTFSILTAIFPGEPGLAGFIEAKDDGVVVTTGAISISHAKLQSMVTTSTNNPTSNFLQSGCPSYHPTNSVKALKGKISHFADLLTPSLLWVCQLCL